MRMVGVMVSAHQYRVSLDSKRRPTLPAKLLAEAQLPDVGELVARVDGPGRIVLEDPNAALGRLQSAVRAGKHRMRTETAMADSLLADRVADLSLGDDAA